MSTAAIRLPAAPSSSLARILRVKLSVGSRVANEPLLALFERLEREERLRADPASV